MSLFVAPRANTDILTYSVFRAAVGIHTGTTRLVPDCFIQYHVETRDKLTERETKTWMWKSLESEWRPPSKLLPVC